MLYVSGMTISDLVRTEIDFEKEMHHLTINNEIIVFSLEAGWFNIWVRYTMGDRTFKISKVPRNIWGGIDYIESKAVKQTEWNVNSNEKFSDMVKQLRE